MRHPIASKVRLGVIVVVCTASESIGAAVLEGQIRGRVTEAATNVPVPGVTITVTSPALGDPRVVTTNEEGEYLVPNLPIGRYTVIVSYAGVRPITREIQVQPGITSPLDIKWSAELAETETTTVTEERPLTNPDSTQTGTVISIDQEKYIPTGRRYTDSVLDVPGVTKNISSATDHIIKGGRSTHNRYLIDGLDVTDPISQTAFQQLAFDSIEAVQVITGGFDAEYNVFGGIINTITRQGSDDWHGSVSGYTTNASLNVGGAQGLSVTERDRLFNPDPVASTYSYIGTATFGGPIIKHRLWFNATFEYRLQHTGRLIGPPLNLPPPPRVDNTYLPRLKITWAPSSKQRLSLSLAADPETQENNRPDTTSQGILPIYQKFTGQGGYNAIFSWNVSPNPNFDFRLDAGIKTQYTNTGPMGWFGRINYRYCDLFSAQNCVYIKDRPTHVNNDDNSTWYNADTDVSLNNRVSVQVDPKITWRGRWFGDHDAKVGLQLKILRNRATLHQTGNLKYLDQGGGPLESGLCDPDNGKFAGCFQRNSSADRSFLNWGYSPGAFIQDHWRPLNWLTLTPGIRFDYGQTRATDGSIFSSQFAVGPRIGLIADITRDQKTIFSTSYGRSNEVSNIGPVAAYDGTTQGAKVQEKWDPPGSPQGRWVFASQVGGAGGGAVDKNAKVPHADQITSSLRREIMRNTVAGLEYTWKRIKNTWDSVETNVIWDPTGYRVLGYVDGLPHDIALYTTPDSNVRTYHGISLSLEGRPTPNWYFLAFYTLSWLYGNVETELYSTSASGIINNNLHRIPQQFRFWTGFLPEDNRHQLHVAASYNFHGLIVGTRLEYLSGSPRNKLFQVPGIPDSTKNIGLRSPRGTDPGTCAGSVPGQGSFTPATTVCDNNAGLVSDFRNPARVQIDLHVEYDFYSLLRQHIAVTSDVFNVFNDRTPTTVQETDATNGNFGLVTARATALNLRLGARYDF